MPGFVDGEIAVEPLVADDIPDLARFAVSAYIDTYGWDLSAYEVTAQELEYAPQLVEASAVDTILVARIGERIVGYSQAGAGEIGMPPEVKELRKLYVAKDMHGAGVGPVLMEAALASPPLADARAVYLWVWGENLRAIRFYAKNAFYPNNIRAYTKDDGTGTYDLRMVRNNTRAPETIPGQ